MDWYLKGIKKLHWIWRPRPAQRVLDVYSGQHHPDRRTQHY